MASTAMGTCQWSGDPMMTASISLVEHLVIIDVGGGETAGAHFYRIATRAVDVADGDDLHGANLFSGIEQGVHAATGSNDSDA